MLVRKFRGGAGAVDILLHLYDGGMVVQVGHQFFLFIELYLHTVNFCTASFDKCTHQCIPISFPQVPACPSRSTLPQTQRYFSYHHSLVLPILEFSVIT